MGVFPAGAAAAERSPIPEGTPCDYLVRPKTGETGGTDRVGQRDGHSGHELPRVFDRGFTGSNGRLRGGSTGMGLYLAKKLADALEISLAIRSEEGVGTQVLLTFPAQEKLTKL